MHVAINDKITTSNHSPVCVTLSKVHWFKADCSTCIQCHNAILLLIHEFTDGARLQPLQLQLHCNCNLNVVDHAACYLTGVPTHHHH